METIGYKFLKGSNPFIYSIPSSLFQKNPNMITKNKPIKENKMKVQNQAISISSPSQTSCASR
uniref:Uncharacterized protein n=1 Tax=Nelumbo nucifera TaxID=4432 RepID=A0A822YVL7_NELNU|nr:TPA_asm: hypothetical protein HUJ06_006069 [Nelumbo nucifera]